MRFTPKSLLCSALLLVTGFTCYFVGKHSVRYPKPTELDCAVYKAQELGDSLVLGNPRDTGVIEDLGRNGRNNEQIIKDLHARYPEPEMSKETFGFNCPKGYYYTSLHFPGDIVKGVEIEGLYIGTCLPEEKQ